MVIKDAGLGTRVHCDIKEQEGGANGASLGWRVEGGGERERGTGRAIAHAPSM
jgi:hypothetical protein